VVAPVIGGKSAERPNLIL